MKEKYMHTQHRLCCILLVLVCCQANLRAQSTLELTTADDGAADIGLYNDNNRGAFTNQDGSGGIDIRDLGPDDITDDSEVTRKRVGLLQFDLTGTTATQITSAELEMALLQGSENALVDIYGVKDGSDILGLAGDGSPGFDPTDPDFHFANSGLFAYYDHEEAPIPDSVPDDDDIVNDGFYDSTLDLDLSKVEFLLTQSEAGDGDADGVIGVFSEETPELLDFIRNDTNGKVLFLLMPTSGEVVTLPNNTNGPAATLFVRIDDSLTPGDFNGDSNLDVDDIELLINGIATNDGLFDLNGDSRTDQLDLSFWVQEIKGTWIGDANLDGEFNSSDFVAVFQAGKFESEQPASWPEGDWNGDGKFNSGDFVAAFQDGGFEIGPRPAVVPEPSFNGLLFAGLLISALRYRYGKG